MLPQMFANRYRVLSLLGQGGMGAVYRCLDEQTQTVVALKTLTAESDTDRPLWRFRREFAAMKRLEHPHCVHVYDYGQEKGVHFFTMEYVDGVAFSQLRGTAHALPLSLQVLSALDYIHGQGIIHRDLKPHNVLVAGGDTPRALLTDFGIAKFAEDDGQKLTSDGGVIGTLAYLSPEQAEGKPVDPRADLYSFGVLFYESLLNRFPYELPERASAIDYLRAHVVEAPIPPGRIAGGFPADLEALLLQLLAKEPSRRPPSAAAVFEALRPYAGGGYVPELSPPGGAHLLAPRFVGRGRELSWVEERWRVGAEPLLCLSGEAGVGKSRLLEELASKLRQQNYRVLRGQAEEGFAQSYALWLDPLRQLYLHEAPALNPYATELSLAPDEDDKTDPDEGFQPDGAVCRVLSPAEREILQKVLPELRPPSVLGGSSAEIAIPGLEVAAQEKWSLLRGLADLLVQHASTQPLAFVLEDLHAADEASLELLFFVVRALARTGRRPPLLLVGAYRSDEVGAEHPLRGTLSRLTAEGLAAELPLGPLSEEESVALLASSLGLSGELEVRQLAARLFGATSGNPFYLSELLKNLVADGRIQRVRGRWQLEGALFGGSLLPENFREALRRRLAKLAPGVKELLELFAVCGRVASLDLLLHGSGLDEEGLLTLLDDAVRAKLIEETETGAAAFRFVNEPVREVLYEDLPPGRKRILHGKVAARLQAQEGAPAEIGRHLLRSGDKETARRYLIKAGDQALRAFDGARAATLYEEAQALGTPDALLCEKLGRAHDLAGDLQAAEHMLRLALDQTSETKPRIWRLRALAEVKRKRGAMAEAAEALEEGMKLLGRPLAKSRVGVLGSIVGQGLLRTAHKMGLSSQVKDAERETEAQVTRLAASLTHVLYYVDYEKSVAAHLHMLNLAERLGPSEEQALAYLYHAVALGTTGNFSETKDFLDKGRKMAEERKIKPLVERAGAYSAWLSWVQGKVEQAGREVDAFLATQRPSDPFDFATLLYVGVASRIAAGQLDGARHCTLLLERLAQETGSRYTQGTARLHYGTLLLAERQEATALPLLEEARAAFLESGGRVYAVASAGFLGAALARQGRHDQAIAVLEEASKDIERFRVKDPMVRVYAFLAESYWRRAARDPGSKDAARDLGLAREQAKLALQYAKTFPVQLPLAGTVAAQVEHARGQEKAARELRAEVLAFSQANGLAAASLDETGGGSASI